MNRKAISPTVDWNRGTPSLEPVADAVRDEATKLGTVAKQWLHQTGDQARHAVDQVSREAHALNERTQDYVRGQPVKSVLIAAAAGAALSALLALTLKRR